MSTKANDRFRFLLLLMLVALVIGSLMGCNTVQGIGRDLVAAGRAGNAMAAEAGW